MSTPYAKEHHFATLAVHRAALLTTRVLAASNKGTISKSDSSPVTIADFGSQALLIHALHTQFPDDQFVGEESSDALRADPALLEVIWSLVSTTHHDDPEVDATSGRISSPEEMLRVIDLGGAGTGGRNGRIWMLDPIDGTKEFVRGGQYAVALALVEGGEQKIGVLGCPNLKLDYSLGDGKRPQMNEAGVNNLEEVDGATWVMLSAVQGQGAIVQTRSRTALVSERKLNIYDVEPADKLCFADFETSSAAMVDQHKLLGQRLDASWPGTRMLALQMRYVALALGAADVAVRMPKQDDYKEPIWDHVGGMLIFEEAGGMITDLDGKTIDFGLGRRLSGNRGVVATRKELHGGILEAASEIYNSTLSKA